MASKRRPTLIAFLLAIFAMGDLVRCTSKEAASNSLQAYCDLAGDMIGTGDAMMRIRVVNREMIYGAWARLSPPDEARQVIDAFYGTENHRADSEDSEKLELQDYREMMAAAAEEHELVPPRCDVLLSALMESNRRLAMLVFVDRFCGEYKHFRTNLLATDNFGAKEHNEAVRSAYARVTGDDQQVNEKGRTFIESLLAVDPALRGKTFARDFANFQGRKVEYGDPCFDLQLDVERLYKEHLEKQETETP